MAQPQCEFENKVSLELSAEDSALLDALVAETQARVTEETLNEAYLFLLQNDPDNKAAIMAAGKQGLVSTTGTMSNSISGTLTRFALQKWDGHFVKSPSSSISASGRGIFEHTAISKPGAKAGVVYSGLNKAGKECGWLLAWHNARGSVRKVYAKCGPKTDFAGVDFWANVSAALDKSGSSVTAEDKATGTKVSAKIVGSSGQSVVTANFSYI